MNEQVRLACDSEVLLLPLEKLLPMRRLDDALGKSAKYRCIEASIREVGLIEPLVVYPQPGSGGSYIILDGHVRHKILGALGMPAAKCLIALDDEGFTYNRHVSRLPPVQEHFMILRSIKNGVSEERIARALDINVATIRQKRDMLDGICPEAVKLLKDKKATGNAFRELRKVKPMRQIEIAELMCASRNFSVGYTKCLVATTAPDQMLDNTKPKDVNGIPPEDFARMEHEITTLGREFKLIEESHGKNTLQLVLVIGYLRKLLSNSRVARHLSQHYAEILAEFQKLLEIKSLNEGNAA